LASARCASVRARASAAWRTWKTYAPLVRCSGAVASEISGTWWSPARAAAASTEAPSIGPKIATTF
jgi:hypothetical protein